MTALKIELPKHRIAHTFSQWASFSALRSGSPLKSREDIYPFLELKHFEFLLTTTDPISDIEFSEWHENAVAEITSDGRLPVGWSAKIINVYLKSICYLSGFGRPGLINHIHPPIDSGLWQGLKSNYKDQSEIWNKVYSKTKIKDIKTYTDYATIIDGMREIAKCEKCLLIEVEKFWEGTYYRKKHGS
jgi:hypothetical protein